MFSYMSKYLTAGWIRFNFIVTPEELETVLADMHALIVSRHVLKGYQETPLQEYIEDYSRFYAKLASGQKIEAGERRISEIGMAKSIKKHPYGRDHLYRGHLYQSTDFDEPCPIIGYFPFYLYTSTQNKLTLTISVSVSQFPENTVGLELFFPKQIQYFNGEDYGPLQTVKDLESYQDYLSIQKRVHAITKPLRLIVDKKEIHPRVRISKNALKDFRNFWFVKENQIQIIN